MPLRIYRRRLPHWRVEGATYFVTWCLHHRRQHLTPRERNIVVSALRHFEQSRHQLLAFVVMDDHVHVLVTPAIGEDLEWIIHSWKSFSAYRIQREGARSGPVWQREYHDWIVRSPRELDARTRYILNNPRRRWPGVRDYPWVWYWGMNGEP